MDAVALMGRIIRDNGGRHSRPDGLVVFSQRGEDNPFMAGAFHGVGEAEKVITVGVSGPGVADHALQGVKGTPSTVVADTIKKTAFRVTRTAELVAAGGIPPPGHAPFGIVDTRAIGDSLARILEEDGPGHLRDPLHGGAGAAVKSTAVKKGGRHGVLPL